MAIHQSPNVLSDALYVVSQCYSYIPAAIVFRAPSRRVGFLPAKTCFCLIWGLNRFKPAETWFKLAKTVMYALVKFFWYLASNWQCNCNLLKPIHRAPSCPEIPEISQLSWNCPEISSCPEILLIWSECPTMDLYSVATLFLQVMTTFMLLTLSVK